MKGPSQSMAPILNVARAATADLPQGPEWILPPPGRYLGLSNFPVGAGCRDPSVGRFTIIGFYGDWGSRGMYDRLMARQAVGQKHLCATAEKFEKWLLNAGFGTPTEVWHTNVLLVLRNAELSKKSESGPHAMYQNYALMMRSAQVNWIVEQAARPALYVTLGIPAAVAFCHTHAGADPEGRFARYPHDRRDMRSFQLGDLYEDPYRLPNGSVLVQLCHPGNSGKNLITRRKKQEKSGYTSDIELLHRGLKMAGLTRAKQ